LAQERKFPLLRTGVAVQTSDLCVGIVKKRRNYPTDGCTQDGE
jgi:hypothetical protein